MLGLVNIGPAFEQLGRQPYRQLRRQRLTPLPAIRSLYSNRRSPRYPLRIIPQKDVDRILRLADLPLQVWNLCICRIEHLSRLKHVKTCPHAVGEAQFGELDGILLGLHRFFCDL